MTIDNHTTQEKRCSNCKKPFPATLDYFPKRGKGLNAECKTCNQLRAEQWIADNKARYLENKRLWREKNREKLRQQERDRYQNEKEKRLEYARNYRLVHRFQLREKTKVYFQENPEKRRDGTRRRKSLVRGLPCRFSPQDEQQMLEYWSYKCAVCGKSADMWTKIVPDHWIPLSDKSASNPGTVKENMIPLCHAKQGRPAGISCCNDSKKNKPAAQWLKERVGTKKSKEIIVKIETYFDWVKSQS